MKIKLEQVGPFTCLPLPAQAVETEGFAPGDHVEVLWDVGRRQFVVRPLVEDGAATRVPPSTGEIPHALDDFLAQYGEAMRELADR